MLGTTQRKEVPWQATPSAASPQSLADPGSFNFLPGKGAHAAPQVDATADVGTVVRTSADPSPTVAYADRAAVGAADGIHPQTAAAWARAIRQRARYRHAPEPLPPASRFALAWPARCDAAALGSWRSLPRAERERRNAESERYWREWDEKRAQADRARLREQAARIAAERARLVGDRSGGDVEARASAWLAKVDAGPGGLWRAALAVVCRFALGADVGLRLLEAEYVPRYHRKVPRVELVGVVRRAARARMAPGDMLGRERR